MRDNAVATDATIAIARQGLEGVADVFDAAAKVWLVEDNFVPGVAASYPAHSAAFAGITAAAGSWQVRFDAESGRFFLVAREPAGGWDFVSLSGGVSIVGYVVELGADTATKMGGNMFDAPIPVGGAGEHISLPYVSLPVNQVFDIVPIPQVTE